MANETWEYRLQKSVRWDSEDAIDDVIYFIQNEFINEWCLTSDEMPTIGQRCWCVNDKNDLYLCIYSKFSVFRKKPTFNNMLGKGWEVQSVVK